MAASAIAKGLTQLLSRNVGARMSAPVYAGEPIEQTLKLQKFAQKQAQQLGPEDASKIIGEGEEGLPTLLYHRIHGGREPFKKFILKSDKTRDMIEKDVTPGSDVYDFLSTGLSKRGMSKWTSEQPETGERVTIGMGKVNKLFDYNNPDHVNDLFKQLRQNYKDENKELFATVSWSKKYKKQRIQETEAKLREQKELVKRGSWQAIEDYDIQEALKDLGYDSFTTIESGKNVMLFNPNEQFVPLFDPLKKSAIGFSRGGGLSSLNEKLI